MRRRGEKISPFLLHPSSRAHARMREIVFSPLHDGNSLLLLPPLPPTYAHVWAREKEEGSMDEKEDNTV